MASSGHTRLSPFLYPTANASAESLAILHLRRDHIIATVLRETPNDAEYAEGHVINTRFGSFPHSTLIGVPWGSQVIASQVDTGARGRKGNGGRGKKRKIEEMSEPDQAEPNDQNEHNSPARIQSKTPVAASSGFIHVLPPTPESWTVSLPHRTQVVYTPDYSHILQKLRVQPGSVLIEAGAGSGSFTHAAARAVFSGYTSNENSTTASSKTNVTRQFGKVYSFEYHEPRAQTLQAEIISHGLSQVVQVTHRDVYTDGFLVSPTSEAPSNAPHIASAIDSPNATAVFLDLPAPWLALPHLTRASPSPLNPRAPIHICCFLPCIEQAQKAVSTLRTLGWVEVCMHEQIHRRIDVRRERVGLELEGLRAVNSSPATVDEAVARLIEVEKNARNRGGGESNRDEDGDVAVGGIDDGIAEEVKKETRAERLARIASSAKDRKAWKEGRLVSRTEPEVKTHTSYLIFGVLPVEWTNEDEDRCRAKWPPARREENGEQGKVDQSNAKKKKMPKQAKQNRS